VVNSKKPDFSWGFLFLILAIGIAASVSQYKVPLAMSFLLDAFRMTAKQGGTLMSVYAVVSLFLALPGGFLFQKMGYRATGSAGIVALIAGAIAGLLSPTYGVLLLSRLLEGGGMSLLTITGSAVIAQRYAPRDRGKAMGVWAMFVPLGMLIDFAVAPSFLERWNWQGLWWLSILYSAVMLVCFLVLVRPRQGESGLAVSGRHFAADKEPVPPARKKDLWRLLVLSSCLQFMILGFLTWFPSFLQKTQGSSLGRLSFIMSMQAVAAVVGGPLGGFLCDRFGWKRIATVMLFGLAILMPLCAMVRSAWALQAAVYGQALVGSMIPPAILAGAAALSAKERHGVTMAFLQTGNSVGTILGPLVLGAVIDRWSWTPAFLLLFPVAFFGACVGLTISVGSRFRVSTAKG
jgi:MFS family permease